MEGNRRGSSISIVIPTYNSKTLGRALQAIVQQRSADRICEIIVAGRQDTMEFAGTPNMKFVHVEKKPSPAHNRNVGAMQAKGDWICFTDSDCVPDPDWIYNLANSYAENTVALAGAVDIPVGMSYWGRCDHFFGFGNLARGMASAARVDYAATCNFCVRRDVYEALGGFDESFPGAAGEDLDFCWRLRQAGHVIVFVPKAIVRHDHARNNFRTACQHLYNYGEALAQFHLKGEWDRAWQLWVKIARVRLLGEIASLAYVILRALWRPIHQPRLLRHWALLPGIALLDLAHTFGMIRTIRSDVG